VAQEHLLLATQQMELQILVAVVAVFMTARHQAMVVQV